ncbi:MAG: nuclear transport factor 2 family protein [Fidelibacterota bacterium]|jgi:ketosteroid isomerase-like protein
MSILKKWEKAINSRDEADMGECLHDDYKFTLHSAGKTLSKSEVISWAMSGDINREKVRILFENDDVGVEHAFVSFEDGNKQAVLSFVTFKDGKIYTLETGASNLPK